MDAAAMQRVLRRLAHEIVEREAGTAGLAIIGIHTGGAYVARRLVALIAECEGVTVPLGEIDITLYRDDALCGLPRPVIGATSLPFEVAERKLLLVDDVLYTGRTVRAALDALNDYGRPRRVRLAVLVDRGHRELPIQADHVGLRLETEPTQRVEVQLAEGGQEDAVVIEPAAAVRLPERLVRGPA
ncbi:MAG: bifunctional pyr operon transcriptional regulator/uracil phosphoribosyltransferase PyrR [Proteobacteria bacterium]|nr:bifunctional pyr operon transcriptional regulator/uracil phosphoribosyltransferase PyrR [Pseudomonadota bacterium]